MARWTTPTLSVKLNPLPKEAGDLKASKEIFMRTSGFLTVLFCYILSQHILVHTIFSSKKPKALSFFCATCLPWGSSCLNPSPQIQKCWTVGIRPFSNLENPKTQLKTFLKFASISQELHGINSNTIHITCAAVLPSFFWGQMMSSSKNYQFPKEKQKRLTLQLRGVLHNEEENG